MDTEISVEMFAKTTRSHWNIECGLHWRLDVIFNEDRSRNREGHSVLFKKKPPNRSIHQVRSSLEAC